MVPVGTCRNEEGSWLGILGVVASGTIAVVLVVAVGRSYKHSRLEMDIHSGRIRDVGGTFWSTTEQVDETWISKALGSVGRVPAKPKWMFIHSETEAPWGKSVGCNIGLPHDGINSMIGRFADRFTPDALALVAEDLLALSYGPPESEERWRKYERGLVKAAIKAKAPASIDGAMVIAIREQAWREPADVR